jgi:hypothetical protein
MRRLRRAVHDQIKPVRLEKLVYTYAMSYVQRNMGEPPRLDLQSLQVPQRIPGCTKKFPPHVVVHAHNVMPLPVEVRHRLGPDQPTAACHQYFHRGILTIRAKNTSKCGCDFAITLPRRRATAEQHSSWRLNHAN